MTSTFDYNNMTPLLGIPEIIYVVAIGCIVGTGYSLRSRSGNTSLPRLLASMGVACVVIGVIAILILVYVTEFSHDRERLDSHMLPVLAMASFASLFLSTPLAWLTYWLVAKKNVA